MFLGFPAQWPCRSLHSIFCCGCLPEVYSKPYIRYFRCHQLRGNFFWSFSSLVSFIYIGFFQTSSFSSAPFWPSFLDGKFDIFYFEALFLFLFIFLEALTADAYIFSPFRGRLLKCWDLILYFWVWGLFLITISRQIVFEHGRTNGEKGYRKFYQGDMSQD